MAVLSGPVSNMLAFSFHSTLSCSSQWSIPHHVLPFGSQMPLSEEIAACVASHCWGFSIPNCNQPKTAKEILGSFCFLLCRHVFFIFDFRLNKLFKWYFIVWIVSFSNYLDAFFSVLRTEMLAQPMVWLGGGTICLFAQWQTRGVVKKLITFAVLQ